MTSNSRRSARPASKAIRASGTAGLLAKGDVAAAPSETAAGLVEAESIPALAVVAVEPEPAEAPPRKARKPRKTASKDSDPENEDTEVSASGEPSKRKGAKETGPEVRVRRLHRRDLNRTWEFLKLVFRNVNKETVEYQRPRSKSRFLDVYDQKGEQLLFEIGDKIVGYAECAFDASGADNWINPRYFDKRGMRPLYVEELAVHPDVQGKGVGGFMLDQVQHLARVRGCTHLVLEVAENNESALSWYRRRNFFKLDAAIFLAQKVPAEPELLPPRKLSGKRLNKDGSPVIGAPPKAGSRRAPKSGGAGRAKSRK